MPRPLHFTGCQRRFLLGTGAFCVTLGLIVMVGWQAHNLPLIQIRPGLSAMHYNTALAVRS